MLRALSLSQPWAWAMTVPEPPLRKDVENRTWKLWESMVGARVAVHAAKSWDPDAVGFLADRGLVVPPREQLATGAIVAVVTIPRQVTAAIELPEAQRGYFFGPYGFVFADHALLATPVPARGMQGFWLVPADVEAAVRAQIGGGS